LKIRKVISSMTFSDWIWVLVTMTLFFGFLWLKERYLQENDPIFNVVIESFLGFLFISILLSRISNKYFFSEITKQVTTTLETSKSVIDLGLKRAYASFELVDFEKLIQSAKKNIDIYAICTSSWINKNLPDLEDFIANNKDASIRVVFLDPHATTATIFGEKYKMSGEGQVVDLTQKIQETASNVNNRLGVHTNQFQLKYQSMPQSYSY